jgi:basic membrane protein A
MPRKNISIIAYLLILGLILASCTSKSPDKTDCTKQEVFCVGLITGLEGINDQSANQNAWEGVLQAQSERVADQVKYIETIDSKDYASNISGLAEAGYDVIITTGSVYKEATIQAASKYSGTLFIGIDQNQGEVTPNLVGLVFHDDQLGFLAGALAAQVTNTNTIAVVLDANTSGSATVLREGYEAGAKFINAGINIIATYYPGEGEAEYTGPRWGAITTGEAIQTGADVIFAAGGSVDKGVILEAIKHPEIYCIGVNDDLWNTYDEAHPCLISSAVKQISSGVYQLVKLAKEGAFPNGNYFGTCGLASYHDFDSIVSQAVKEHMTSIATGIEKGTITTSVTAP